METDFSRKQWFFLWSLPVLFILIVGGFSLKNALAARHAAALAAAVALQESQMAAVQRRMTVFPSPPHREVASNMASYLVSGAGNTGYNGIYVENGTVNGYPAYQLDSGHWLSVVDGIGYCLSTSAGIETDDGYHNYDTVDPDPTGGTWEGGMDATPPAPTVTEYVPVDTTAPTIDTVTGVSISKVGSDYKITIPFTDAGTVSGTSGFSLTGTQHGPITFSAPDITNNVLTYTLSRDVYQDETALKLNYAPGDFTDDASNALEAFSDLAVDNNSTQEYVPMPITFTIETGANKALAIPTSVDEDVTIAQTQKGSDGTLDIPARVPMLNKNFSTRMAEAVGDLDNATPLDKSMMLNCDLSALVNPIWFFDENEETFQSHVDGEEPQRTIGLRVSKSSSDLSALQALRTAQPATPRWYQLRGVHADDSKYSIKTEFFASPNAAVTLGAGNNVRYVEFPMSTKISGEGFAMRFKHTEPA